MTTVAANTRLESLEYRFSLERLAELVLQPLGMKPAGRIDVQNPAVPGNGAGTRHPGGEALLRQTSPGLLENPLPDFVCALFHAFPGS